jgi:pyruvate/2-oxoglutarate dehydrogenase complex dihydrolipoamide acyltransferase (E2) component
MRSRRSFSIKPTFKFDARIVDDREAVTFLVRVKECLEDPARIVLDL